MAGELMAGLAFPGFALTAGEPDDPWFGYLPCCEVLEVPASAPPAPAAFDVPSLEPPLRAARSVS